MTVLTWPNAPVSAVRRTLRTSVSGAMSPFTLSEQVQDWGGEVWEYEFDLPPQRQREGKALEAFFNRLGGKRGRFVFADPSICNPPSGAPVVSGFTAEARVNIWDWSEAFDQSAWSKSGVTVTPDVAAAFDGSMIADRLVETATSGEHFLDQSKSVSVGNIRTIAVDVRADGSGRNLRLRTVVAAGANSVDINPDAGTAVISGNASILSHGIIDLGGGWYRAWMTSVAVATGTGVYRLQIVNGALSVYEGSESAGIFLARAMLNGGDLLDYQRVDATFTPSVPAVAASGQTGNRLVTSGWAAARDQRNLLRQSEQFGQSPWGRTGCTVSPNTLIAPDGTLTADTLTATGTSFARTAQTVPLGAGQHALSIHVKAGTAAFLSGTVEVAGQTLRIYANVGTGAATATASTGTISATALPSVDLGNGWVRFSWSINIPVAGGYNVFFAAADAYQSFAVTVGRTIHLWGAQLELGGLTEYQRTPSAVLYVGEFFSLGDGSATRLYQLTADVVPDNNGVAFLDFVPRLRSSPVPDAPLQVRHPRVLLRSTGPVPANISVARHYTFSVQAREAI